LAVTAWETTGDPRLRALPPNFTHCMASEHGGHGAATAFEAVGRIH